MLKNLLRAASLISALAIGGVLVVRAAGCTNEKPVPVTPPPPAPEAPAAPVDAGSAAPAPVDAGGAQSFKLPDNAFLPATKAAAPIFHPPAEPQPQQATPPK